MTKHVSLPSKTEDTRPTDKQESVCALVVTHNRCHLLRDNVGAIINQRLPPAEIVVVDNNSSDGTVEFVRQTFPQVHVIELRLNTGPAGGFAVGFIEALTRGHDWIWAFNDDDRPLTDNALATLLNAAKYAATQPIGLVAGWARMVDGNGEVRYIEKRGWTGSPLYGRTYSVNTVPFCGALISMDTVRQVGVPQSDFFMMMEEHDFCWRARRAGFAVAVTPVTLVDALAEGSLQSPPWRAYYQTRNELLMALRRRSLRQFFRWVARQFKFCVATITYHDRKLERLGLRALGTWHAITRQTGMKVIPE